MHIFQWKGKLPAGATYNNPVMGFDVHATALAAAGVDVPANKPIDGKNLIPYIIGQKTGKPHAQLFWRSSAQHAARVGDWKLVVASRTPPMLFNLAEDIGEQKDLAQKRPDKLKEVQAIYADWSSQMMEPQWIRQDGNNAELGGKLKAGTSTQSRLETYFRSADSNGDGRVSAEEFKRPNVFKAVDKNKDGFATLKEMRDYYANRQK